MGRAARAGDRGTATTSTSSPTARCPTPTRPRCRRCSPTSRRAASPGTTSSTGWVWTTFNDYQWDLNWSNPDVLCEFADIILSLANLGVEVFRLDAIAFIWKRLGTDCQNQPEVHDLTRALRTVARIACPPRLFKAEAIVGPADLPAYLGVGEHAGKVSDLAYHNGLMVQVWSMLASRDARLASHALQQLPQPPSTTAWITYVRCHDDIGWAIADEDARAVGLDAARAPAVPVRLLRRVVPGLVGARAGLPAERATGDRRISGSLASLAGLEAGDPHGRRAHPARARDHPGLRRPAGDLDGRRARAAQRPGWADDPDHAADNRWVHRPRMPWPTSSRPRPARHHVGPAAPDRRTTLAAAPARGLAHRGAGTRATPACCSSSGGTRRPAPRRLQRHRPRRRGWPPTSCTGWACTPTISSTP